MKNPQFMDFFVAGLTGSGKTITADYIQSYYNCRHFRLAGTIKQIICEQNNITPEELEVLKRENPEWRQKHHDVSAVIGCPLTSMNRARLLATRRAFDFTIVNDPEKPIIIGDVRSEEEADILLFENFIGIFLARTTNEYQAGHWTDNSMFGDGSIERLSHSNNEYADNMIVVFNGKQNLHERTEFVKKLHPNTTVISFETPPNADQLIEAIDKALLKWIPLEDRQDD
jgi:hypothetical protein